MMQGILIFGLRILDTSLQTLRLMMIARGYKLLTALFGFAGSFIFILAISPVIQNMDSWMNLVGYAAGFATGGVIGLMLEDRLAMGYTILRIISSRRGAELAEKLRGQGYAVTEVPARGKDGYVSLLYCFVPRRRAGEVVELVQGTDEASFISAEDVRPVRRGFWPV